jgi:hypothetical protein
VAISKEGDIYVAGGAGNDWIVRKSSQSNNKNWQTIDQFQYVKRKNTTAMDIAIAPNGSVFVIGFANNEKGKQVWLVRRSDDKGLSWNTVDVFESSGKAPTQGMAIATDKNDRIFAGGDLGGFHWKGIVRMSTDNGESWKEIDRQGGKQAGFSAGVESLVADDDGNIYSIGCGKNTYNRRPSTGCQGTIRKLSHLSDRFSPGPEWRGGLLYSLLVDKNHHIYLGGVTVDGTASHWTIRRLGCQQ